MVLRNSRWMPPASVNRHCGESLLPTMDFFIPPPSEIGKILSAETNVNLTQPHPSPVLNCTVLAIATVVAAIGADVLVCIAGGANQPQPRMILGFGFALFVLYLGCTYYPLFPYCSYVGEEGIAQYWQFSTSIQKNKRSVLRFQDATKLFHQQIISFYNGIYSGTSYTYTWKAGDRIIHNSTGYYYSQHNPPRASHAWHFLYSGEIAWTNHVWHKAEKSFHKLGYVEFDVTAGFGEKTRGVRVGEGWVEFLLKDNRFQRFSLTEMKQISLNNGLFQFTHQDAKWFSSDGRFAFNYSGLANAKLFLLCMERIANKNFVVN